MRLDTQLLKHAAFWAAVVIGWVVSANLVSGHRALSVIAAIAWVAFLVFFFTKVWPTRNSN
jgi:hypothetical protein